jgi:hypothetical protein
MARHGVTQQDARLSEVAREPSFANLLDDQRGLREISKAPEQLAVIKFDVKVPK